MLQAWQSTAAGRHLSGRRSKHTEPEMLLRRAVHGLGLRYALHKRLAKGCTPDLVLVRHRLAVFVDGDFFHGCPKHGRTEFSGPNADLWREKLARNKERDRRADQLADESGYRVLRLWECQVRSDPAGAARLVAEAARAERASAGA